MCRLIRWFWVCLFVFLAAGRPFPAAVDLPVEGGWRHIPGGRRLSPVPWGGGRQTVVSPHWFCRHFLFLFLLLFYLHTPPLLPSFFSFFTSYSSSFRSSFSSFSPLPPFPSNPLFISAPSLAPSLPSPPVMCGPELWPRSRHSRLKR